MGVGGLSCHMIYTPPRACYHDTSTNNSYGTYETILYMSPFWENLHCLGIFKVTCEWNQIYNNLYWWYPCRRHSFGGNDENGSTTYKGTLPLVLLAFVESLIFHPSSPPSSWSLIFTLIFTIYLFAIDICFHIGPRNGIRHSHISGNQ